MGISGKRPKATLTSLTPGKTIFPQWTSQRLLFWSFEQSMKWSGSAPTSESGPSSEQPLHIWSTLGWDMCLPLSAPFWAAAGAVQHSPTHQDQRLTEAMMCNASLLIAPQQILSPCLGIQISS